MERAVRLGKLTRGWNPANRWTFPFPDCRIASPDRIDMHAAFRDCGKGRSAAT